MLGRQPHPTETKLRTEIIDMKDMDLEFAMCLSRWFQWHVGFYAEVHRMNAMEERNAAATQLAQ